MVCRRNPTGCQGTSQGTFKEHLREDWDAVALRLVQTLLGSAGPSVARVCAWSRVESIESGPNHYICRDIAKARMDLGSITLTFA
jgi:hypothetical protein